MASGSHDRLDPDGVRIVRAPRPRLDTWAVVAAGALVTWLALRPGGSPPPPPAAGTATPVTPTAALSADASRVRDETPEAAARRETRRREIVARRIARKVLPRTRGPEGKPEVAAADAIAALRAAGVTDGIAAFNPPGTDPPRSGVIVPEDVVLPEGFVRHHQTTDEGEALPPILLFHPDYEFFDESGRRVDVPHDLVVPPDLVPPEIPIEILEPPDGPASRRR